MPIYPNVGFLGPLFTQASGTHNNTLPLPALMTMFAHCLGWLYSTRLTQHGIITNYWPIQQTWAVYCCFFAFWYLEIGLSSVWMSAVRPRERRHGTDADWEVPYARSNTASILLQYMLGAPICFCHAWWLDARTWALVDCVRKYGLSANPTFSQSDEIFACKLGAICRKDLVPLGWARSNEWAEAWEGSSWLWAMDPYVPNEYIWRQASWTNLGSRLELVSMFVQSMEYCALIGCLTVFSTRVVNVPPQGWLVRTAKGRAEFDFWTN